LLPPPRPRPRRPRRHDASEAGGGAREARAPDGLARPPHASGDYAAHVYHRPVSAAPPQKTILARLKRGLFMTHTELIAKVGDAIKTRFEPDPRALEALEEALIAADVGPSTAAELVERVREEAGRHGAEETDVVRRVLKEEVERRLTI